MLPISYTRNPWSDSAKNMWSFIFLATSPANGPRPSLGACLVGELGLQLPEKARSLLLLLGFC